MDYKPSPAHRPSVYTQEKHDKIVACISKNLPYEAAAWGAKICEATLYNWMMRGREDRKNGINSSFVQLLEDIHEAEQKKIAEHLHNIETCDSSAKNRMWILERRWRKFFGTESHYYQELLDRTQKLEQLINSITDMSNNLQGAKLNGESSEIHSESD